MLYNELADTPVRIPFFPRSLSLADQSLRFASFLYTQEEREVIDRLWEETMNEFSSYGDGNIVEFMKRA